MAQQFYHVTNIVWDTDGEDIDLPTEAVVKADPEAVKDDDILFANTLSDHYGWGVEGLNVTPVPDEFSEEELKRLLALPQLDA
jgi:hypothetical protein